MNEGNAPEYELRYYFTSDGKCPITEMLDAMPSKHRGKAIKFLKLLAERGPNLTRPYVDAVQGKIRELVVDIQRHGYRFLHFYDGKKIVVAHVFLKKTQRTPESEIETALKRMEDWRSREE